ncbi:Ppx/GppA phosphatase family protein [Kribbella solani]|uniref:Ppx/GppA phosphatase family protein n=1 Tax=Kribbella solani TaxID=236067 RepID=UPI0029BA4B58|nr:Ppx/GppA phosphatase family protein [Kribbella solani]MDX2971411.1 Ppx/GppA phosphatase family protein [Kribbella solani]
MSEDRTRVAAIDCGTNSIRLLIADVRAGQLTEVDRRMMIVRLGQGVDATGAFAPEALERVFRAADEYAEVIRSSGATRVRFVATSAARDVSNRDAFLEGIQSRLGTTPEIITGPEEAHLTFQGATQSLPALTPTSGAAGEPVVPGPYLVADIGGGSTELILGNSTPTARTASADRASADRPAYADRRRAGASDVIAAESLDLGSVRLTERHVTTDPTSPAELAAIARDIDALLDHTTVPIADARALVAVAGTATTVAAVALNFPEYDRAAVHHAQLSADALRAATTWLTTTTRADRAAVRSIHPGRVDVIGAGALILQHLFDRLPITTLTISEHDILDGVALSLAD